MSWMLIEDLAILASFARLWTTRLTDLVNAADGFYETCQTGVDGCTSTLLSPHQIAVDGWKQPYDQTRVHSALEKQRTGLLEASRSDVCPGSLLSDVSGFIDLIWSQLIPCGVRLLRTFSRVLSGPRVRSIFTASAMRLLVMYASACATSVSGHKPSTVSRPKIRVLVGMLWV